MLEIRLSHALGRVDIRVVQPRVVVLVGLDRIEPGQPERGETQMVRARNPGLHVLDHPEILQRLEPRVEDGLGRVVVLEIPAVDRSVAGIDVEVHVELIALGLVRVARQVRVDIGLRSVEPLFFTAPDRDPNRPPGPRPNRMEDSQRLHHGRGAVRVVRRAGRGVPRVEVAAEQHDLILQDRVGPGNVGDDVVGVAIGVVERRLHVHPKLHGHVMREQLHDHVVLLAHQDDRRRRGRRIVSAGLNEDRAEVAAAGLDDDRRTGDRGHSEVAPGAAARPVPVARPAVGVPAGVPARVPPAGGAPVR